MVLELVVDEREIVAKLESDSGVIGNAGSDKFSGVTETVVVATLPQHEKTARIEKARPWSVRVVERPNPLQREIFVAKRPEDCVGADRHIVGPVVGESRGGHGTDIREGVEHLLAYAHDAEILVGKSVFACRLHVQHTEIGVANPSHQSGATEDSDGFPLIQADAPAVEQATQSARSEFEDGRTLLEELSFLGEEQ